MTCAEWRFNDMSLGGKKMIEGNVIKVEQSKDGYNAIIVTIACNVRQPYYKESDHLRYCDDEASLKEKEEIRISNQLAREIYQKQVSELFSTHVGPVQFFQDFAEQ
jgi:hypothetical protein